MNFKHPEILYGLFLLVIPILIHLFQLQKFEKVSFTNVKLLKSIEQQSRKSSNLKKWLLLLTRLLVFFCLIIAFSQPFFGNKSKNKNKETIIYLDNSLSMKAVGNNGPLLQTAIQELIEVFSLNDQNITLITNNNVTKDVTPSTELLDIKYHYQQKSIKSVLLETQTLLANKPDVEANVIFISDFQNQQDHFQEILIDSSFNLYCVQLAPKFKENMSIDSLWLSKNDDQKYSLKALIKNHNAPEQNISVSYFEDQILKGKSSISIAKDESQQVDFLTEYKSETSGKLVIDDIHLTFDNTQHFVLPKKKKSKVLSIGKNSNFISKVYTLDEFEYTHSELSQLNYSSIDDQDLIIFNEIERFQKPLQISINNFIKQGGRLVIIPSVNSDLNSYNELFNSLNTGSISKPTEDKKLVTTINYQHPFFKNVFKEQIKNFQYPYTNLAFGNTFKGARGLLNYQDGAKFISAIRSGSGNIYWIASPLDTNYSNFIASPLVIPVFINFAKKNTTKEQLYYEIGKTNEIEVNSQLNNDMTLFLEQNENSFIPLQINKTNEVIITTDIEPSQAGIFDIKNNDSIYKLIAFNFDQSESKMHYLPIEEIAQKHNTISYFKSVKNVFNHLNEQNKSNNLWQLFLIFALIFLGIEVLLQKFLKINK